MPKVIKTQTKIDNSNNTTYVIKKYNNNTYKLFTYQKNMSSGCYYLIGVQSGQCIN